jgi:ubiquinone/menaquinone biosynthesis C-methylase UbiE
MRNWLMRNWDSIARCYRWLEYLGFGRALERRREAFLYDVADARRALALGDGDGRALAALRKAMIASATPVTHIDYVDISAKMLELARVRAGTDQIAYYCDDALTCPLPDAEYDLIVTHFFLDCFDEKSLARLAARVAGAAAPRARWIVSEFRRSGWLVRGLYLFFGLTTGLRTRRLVDHHPVLTGHGFRLTRSESTWGGLLASELWARDNSARA